MHDPESGKEKKNYWCFISYRHADNREDDREWAKWLHQEIERYEVPAELVGSRNDRGDTIPERIYPVFRDEESLPADADLARSIEVALDRSKFLTVLCSPRAVQSRYVAQEVQYFQRAGKQDRIIAAIIAGEPGDPERECFPETLREAVSRDGTLSEPIAADFRLKDGSEGFTSSEAYRLHLNRTSQLGKRDIITRSENYDAQLQLMKLKVIAGILGVPLETLRDRDKAYQLKLAKLRARKLSLWLSAVGVLAMVSLFFAFYARKKQFEAYESVLEAAKKAWGASQQAFDQDDGARTGLARLSEAMRYNQRLPIEMQIGAIRQDAAMRLLRLPTVDPLPVVKSLTHRHHLDDAAFSPDGKWVVTAGGEPGRYGIAQVWDVETGTPVGEPMKHEGVVETACFSPDGTLLVTASIDKTARIWNAQTGQPVGNPLQHELFVYSACFHPDGTHVVTSCGEYDKPGSAQVWDVESNEPVGAPMPHDHIVKTAKYNSVGTRIVTASYDGTSRVWDALSGQPVGQPMVHNDQVREASFHPDGTIVITASKDHTAKLWDAETGEQIGAPLHHKGEVFSASFSNDGTRAITASADHTARVWDVETGQPVGEEMQHSREVDYARFSPDGMRVVTASYDQTARIWDAVSGEPVSEPLEHDSFVVKAYFNPDSTQVLSVGLDKTARIWSASAGEVTSEVLRHNDRLNTASFSPDGHQVLTAGNDVGARLWNAWTGEQIGDALRHEDRVIDARFSSDGTKVVTASRDKTARIWNVESRGLAGEPLQHQDIVRSVVFSPDRARVVTNTGAFMAEVFAAQIWDVETGEKVGNPMQHGAVINQVIFSPDGGRLATSEGYHAGGGEAARIWDAFSGEPLTEPMRHDSSITSICFSPDGRFLATTSLDKTARIWNVATGKPRIDPIRHNGFVRSASFDSSGKQLLTSVDGTTFGEARIWDARTGKPLFDPMYHEDSVDDAIFSPDELRVLTISPNNDISGSVNLWDPESGNRIGEPMSQMNDINSVTFGPDGFRLLTSGDDDTARIWEVFPSESKPPDPVVLEVFGGYRVSQDGEVVSIPVDERVELRTSILDNFDSSCDWSRLLQWRFSSSSDRKISPNSQVSIRQVVEKEMVWVASLPPESDYPEFLRRRIVRSSYALMPDHPLMPYALALVEEDERRRKFFIELGDSKLERNPEASNSINGLLIRSAVFERNGDEEVARALRNELKAKLEEQGRANN